MWRPIYRLLNLAIYKVVLNVKAAEVIGISGMLQLLAFGVCQAE
jgi:hypothetical protein